MINGKWEVWAETPLGRQGSILDLSCEEGGILRGTVSNVNTGELAELKKGRWEGEHFSFRAQLSVPPLGKLVFMWEGDVDGDKVSGFNKVVMGKTPYEGKRVE